MKRPLILVAAAFVALQPPTLKAQLYNGSPPTTASFDFVGALGSVPGTFGAYVGPYTGDFIGDAAGAFSVYCVDYLHYAMDTNPVNVSQLSGDLSATRLSQNLSDDVVLTKYRQSAYLASLFESWSDYGSQTEVFSALHAAIWNVTSGATLGSGNVASLRTTFLTMAGDAGNLASVDLDDWYVITADAVTDGYGQGRYVSGLSSGNPNDGKGQEFLMRRTVPEPGTLLLLITGLGLMFAANRKRVLALEDL